MFWALSTRKGKRGPLKQTEQQPGLMKRFYSPQPRREQKARPEGTGLKRDSRAGRAILGGSGGQKPKNQHRYQPRKKNSGRRRRESQRAKGWWWGCESCGNFSRPTQTITPDMVKSPVGGGCDKQLSGRPRPPEKKILSADALTGDNK